MKKFKTLSRRDAIKFFGVTGVGILACSNSKIKADTKLSMPSSKKNARIVIAGGGTAGMVAASRIRRAAPNAKIILIAPNTQHLYQPGQLFVATGLSKPEQNIRKTANLLPNNVTWLQEKVMVFDPENNVLEAEKSGKILYDILIVALGTEYDWSRIKGLEESMIGQDSIASVYDNNTLKGETDAGIKSRRVFIQMQKEARKRHIEFLCTEPNTPIKGVGTTLSILLLYSDRLKREGLSNRVRFTFSKADETLFPSNPFQKQLWKEIDKYNNIRIAYGFNLTAINTTDKKAIYSTSQGKKELPYDFIHIVPPMQASKVLASSPLAIKDGKERGWMLVNPKTLQHPKYQNVFGIGDILGDTSGKSGGAIQHQGIILQDNITAALEEKPLPYSYDGYTLAPIITTEGKILLAEYNKQKPLPTFPLNPMISRHLWWWIQKDVMPRAYFDVLLRGMM